MRYTGFKLGLVFFLLSIVLTLTVLVPVLIIITVDEFGSSVDKLFAIGNVGGTTFYTCITICIIALGSYISSLFKFKQHSVFLLGVLFTAILVFLNSAIVYYDIRLPEARVDGQQSMAIIGMPMKTSLLYLVFGWIHELVMKTKTTAGS